MVRSETCQERAGFKWLHPPVYRLLLRYEYTCIERFSNERGGRMATNSRYLHPNIHSRCPIIRRIQRRAGLHRYRTGLLPVLLRCASLILASFIFGASDTQVSSRRQPESRGIRVRKKEREKERERGRKRERDRQTTIVVANLHVFHIRGRPFSSDLDAERYVVKHMAFNARGIAHRSEERDPLIFGNHANHAFFSSGRVNRHPPHWHSIRGMGLFLERCT